MAMIAIATLAISVAAACGSSKKSSSGGGTAVTGTVYVDSGAGAPSPAAGATVQAVGGPSTTAAADGSFTLLLASNSAAVIRATVSGAVGTETKIVVPPGGLSFNMNLPSTSQVSAVAGILGVTFDTSKGIVGVNFGKANSQVTTTGYGASISATSAGSFVFGTSGAPQMGTATLTTNNATVIFYNVNTGTTTVTPAPPSGTCADPFGNTDYPVDAGIITNVHLQCT